MDLLEKLLWGSGWWAWSRGGRGGRGRRGGGGGGRCGEGGERLLEQTPTQVRVKFILGREKREKPGFGRILREYDLDVWEAKNEMKGSESYCEGKP